MDTKLFSLPSIVTIIFLVSLPNFPAQDSDRFPDCSTMFRCGETLEPIGYPFWGASRPSSCGLRGFGLRCNNNSYVTIDIDSQTFRVLRINQSNQTMRIARSDLWDDICHEKIENTSMNPTLFHYTPGDRELTLYYNCPRLENLPNRNTFRCVVNGSERTGYYADKSFPAVELSKFDRCEYGVSVPVRGSGLEELRENGSFALTELVNNGFKVEYRMDGRRCSDCERSGGLCWSGTNSMDPTCLCSDGAQPFVCRSRNRGSKHIKIQRIGLGIGAALGIGLFICFLIYYNKKMKRTRPKDRMIETFIRQHGSMAPRRYKYSELKKFTNSFRHELGKGGYGRVYKGSLPNNCLVAVKVLNESKNNREEFVNEVASIGRTSHVNIVSLLGFCYEGEKRALVYEFMPNKSLENFINYANPLSGNHHLGYEKLIEIATGIARGLEYLHRGCNTPIIQLDIKPHNILLDQDFCPKISDFGLSKLCLGKDNVVSMSEARGTIGYIAPEVFNRNFGPVSHKSDVYSYGMMVLEMVGGRHNVDIGVVRTSEIYFPHWIYMRLELDNDLKLLGFRSDVENETAWKMIIVGLWCIQTDPSQRPSMSKVLEMLEGSIEALQIPPKPFLSSPRLAVDSSSQVEV